MRLAAMNIREAVKFRLSREVGAVEEWKQSLANPPLDSITIDKLMATCGQSIRRCWFISSIFSGAQANSGVTRGFWTGQSVKRNCQEAINYCRAAGLFDLVTLLEELIELNWTARRLHSGRGAEIRDELKTILRDRFGIIVPPLGEPA